MLIDDVAIRFITSKPGDSRTWLYPDIETIGTANDCNLRITTLAETYHLELNDRLPKAAYQMARRKIYRLPESAMVE